MTSDTRIIGITDDVLIVCWADRKKNRRNKGKRRTEENDVIARKKGLRMVAVKTDSMLVEVRENFGKTKIETDGISEWKIQTPK